MKIFATKFNKIKKANDKKKTKKKHNDIILNVKKLNML
jgi:carbamoylphosphate synthase large subunit